MRNLLNPRWIFIINVLPVIILFFLCIGEYQIIKSLLDEKTIFLWKAFGLALAILLILNVAYALILEFKKRKVSIWYSVIALLTYIPFLYIYGNYAHEVIPFNIPRWMTSDNILTYVGTFLMPTLMYALLILVVRFTPDDKKHAAWKSFLIAVGIPVFFYLMSQVIEPLWKIIDSEFSRHAAIIFFITATLAFLFFLVRSVYILSLKKAEKWRKYQLAWKIPISIVFPLLGLALNNGELIKSSIYSDHVFGNFTNIWFYILAIINGLFICLPNLENRIYRLLLLVVRSITFAYTFYFFLVFLPYLPLSILAVIAFGLGFLMLTPLILFVIHVNELSKDFSFIKKQYSSNIAIIAPIIAFLILPACITFNYLNDKVVLNQALEYLYSPDYSKTYQIDRNSLRKTMDQVAFHKTNNRDFIFGDHIPYLSSYFSWLVLDNMTLSDSKHDRIENVFFGSGYNTNRFPDTRRDTIKISNIKAESKFDTSQNVWKSNIDIELTNKNVRPWPAEFVTNFELPQGCYISDYYLYIGDKKEMGILAEKKSAMWVFQQITNARRDPGILYYLNGNRVAFRVSPFALGEVRKTGIELIHKEPVKLTIDSNTVELGNITGQPTIPVTESGDKSVVYISASEKQKLPLVQREAYYHFLIDVSKSSKEYVNDYIIKVDSVIKTEKISSKGAKVSFVGTYITTCSITDDWKSILKGQQFEGGFFLDRALKSIIVESYKTKSKSYPLLVVLTNNMNSAEIDDNIADYRIFYPETDKFYELNYRGKLLSHSLLSHQIDTINSFAKDLNSSVRTYPDAQNPIAYLPDDHKASIVLKNGVFDLDQQQIKEKDWQTALLMQGKYISQTLHPEIAEKEWLNLVKYSFISKIMNPYTSYIVVENEAQKAVLKKKQELVLSGNKNLDLSEDITRMSEPGLFLVLLLLGLFLWFRERKKLRKRLISK